MPATGDRSSAVGAREVAATTRGHRCRCRAEGTCGARSGERGARRQPPRRSLHGSGGGPGRTLRHAHRETPPGHCTRPVTGIVRARSARRFRQAACRGRSERGRRRPALDRHDENGHPSGLFDIQPGMTKDWGRRCSAVARGSLREALGGPETGWVGTCRCVVCPAKEVIP